MFAEDFSKILNMLWAMTVIVFGKCKKVMVYLFHEILKISKMLFSLFLMIILN